jgi:hypothetical protein
VEDVHVDASTFLGISMAGDRSVVRRCGVTSTGGALVNAGSSAGIQVNGDLGLVRDKLVSGVTPTRYSAGHEGRGDELPLRRRAGGRPGPAL